MKAKLLEYALPVLIVATIHVAEAQPKKVARLGFLSLQFPETVSAPPIESISLTFAGARLRRKTEHLI